MKIKISKGKGAGPTELSAFDSSLLDAGIANYNLIYLSSIIPPKTEIVIEEKGIMEVPGDWGDKLHVVIAQERTSVPNTEAWAGIGWVQDPKSKKGLFVEHHGHSKSTVKQDIEDSLDALCLGRGIDFGEKKMVLQGNVCKDRPVCALVVAVYQATNWDNKPSFFKD